MKSNRRSVLIGLGALTVGGGAVFGTGAFSSVEAEREVTVETTGDASALLQFSEPNEYDGFDLEGAEDGAATLVFSDLNEDADTTFDGALELENTGSQTVGLSINDSPAALEASIDGDGTLDPGSDATDTITFTVELRENDESDAEGDLVIEATTSE